MVEVSIDKSNPNLYAEQMIKYLKIVIALVVLNIVSCKETSKKDEASSKQNSKVESQELSAEAIVQNAIVAHGGAKYDKANYEFVFRDKIYMFNNTDGAAYRVNFKDSIGNRIEDNLNNGSFSRTINDELVDLSEKDVSIHSNALNSVIYFATLPHKLNDKAVHKELIGETVIKGEDYDIVRVTFGKEGGGKDHDDIFMYWVHKQSHFIDYLAYSYSTNNGGVRFRSAYNQRTIDGIRFQDYINWAAPVGTPLKDLPTMFEKNELKELSRIETENVRNLNATELIE